jgi:long-chain acyl-CoA synthetase
MSVDWLLERIASFGDRQALIGRDRGHTYDQLADSIVGWRHELRDREVGPGEVVALCGDYSPDVCSLLVALLISRAIVVPLGALVGATAERQIDVAQVDHIFSFNGGQSWVHRPRADGAAPHPLLERLRRAGDPGLVVFTSGSTGESKGAVLSVGALLGKFRTPRHGYRTLVFLQLDHIGGINTLLHILTQGGAAATIGERTPEAVCAAIAAHQIELLPTTPTFLNMLLISEAYRRHDLSSLKLITYGTEPMPASTLAQLGVVLPTVRLKQTYGLTEVGIVATQSRDSSSLWMRLGGDGVEYKIVDDVLWLRCDSAMLGYLNAPAPFDSEGWFNTQDMVETNGEYVKILGRRGELVNVGGAKVYPTKVESVLLELSNVEDVTVHGRQNPVTGAIVVARVSLRDPEDPAVFRRRMRQHCRGVLEPYEIPALVEFTDQPHYSERFKKTRSMR